MAFQIDPSVLNAASLRLAVIGNNISNSGVTGFKGSDFSDVLATSNPIGGANGVRISGARQLFTQGSIQSSNNSMDMAINGQGFYRLYRPSDASFAYTRDGSFNLDKNGYVTTPAGDILTGYGIDASDKVSVGTLKELQIDTRNSAPKATQSAVMNLLLDSRLTAIVDKQSTPLDPSAKAFTPSDASTYTSTTISTIYDQQGTSHTLQSYYVKRSAGNWDVYTSMDGNPSNSTPATAANGFTAVYPTINPQNAIFPSATLSFGQDGTLQSYSTWNSSTKNAANQVATQDTVNLQVTYTDSSANPQTFNLDITRTKQYASDFLASTQQDGFPTGQFQGVSVDKDGTLSANYTSGQSRVVGQVILASFPSETSLAQDRNNQFIETAGSGAPVINQPGKGGAGQILGSSIETAGVDLTSEMIKLISAQRTYQANSEVVKRQDQIMQTIIGIGQ